MSYVYSLLRKSVSAFCRQSGTHGAYMDWPEAFLHVVDGEQIRYTGQFVQ